jgi:hypothetical protein
MFSLICGIWIKKKTWTKNRDWRGSQQKVEGGKRECGGEYDLSALILEREEIRKSNGGTYDQSALCALFETVTRKLFTLYC